MGNECECFSNKNIQMAKTHMERDAKITVTNDQGNANQNHNELSQYSC